jgi:hypothetical protein
MFLLWCVAVSTVILESFFRTIDTALLLFLAPGYFRQPLSFFTVSVCSDVCFVGLFMVFGVSSVVVWCVSAAGGVLYGCDMLRIPNCLDSRLTDGGETVSPTHWPHSTPQKHFFFSSGTHFC